MSSYILSTANRFYAAIESGFGNAAAVTAQNRFIANRVQVRQVVTPSLRRDKTGSRTLLGGTANGLRTTAFTVQSYLTSNGNSGLPSCGPLFESALGCSPRISSGLIVANLPNPATVQTILPHGLSIGSAIAYAGEVRFVTAILDALTVNVNAPFSTIAPPGITLATVATYRLGTLLPSITIYDYWDPSDAVSRIITGATVNSFELLLSGSSPEFVFSGPAADLLDSVSFVAGASELSGFPSEPVAEFFNYSIVPGQLGQVWLGNNIAPFFTLIDAVIRIENNVQVRGREFGSAIPLAVAPGPRHVSVDFTLMVQDDTQTTALYQMAKNRDTIGALLQLGQQPGQMMAIYLPGVMPEIPAFDDSGQRLAWQFSNNRASGVTDDEIYIAFA
jgi:hypothetical protein